VRDSVHFSFCQVNVPFSSARAIRRRLYSFIADYGCDDLNPWRFAFSYGFLIIALHISMVLRMKLYSYTGLVVY
jgi:hypothetical protein